TSGVDILAVQFHRARPVLYLRNIKHRKLKRFANLLCRQSNAVGLMHGFDHVLGEFANPVVNFLDPVPLRPEHRVAILHDRQLHRSPRVNAGRFFTPASFNASITLTMVPKDAFLSACSASDVRRVSGKFFTALSKSSTAIVFPSSLISSFSLTVRSACSSSAGALVAVFDSGKLICTSGWSFLNVVETTKKISRIVRMSTSETIMIEGARRFRTAKFILSRLAC